jgi:hypothetical protein
MQPGQVPADTPRRRMLRIEWIESILSNRHAILPSLRKRGNRNKKTPGHATHGVVNVVETKIQQHGVFEMAGITWRGSFEIEVSKHLGPMAESVCVWVKCWRWTDSEPITA